MGNNKIKLVVEIDEYYRDAIIRHRDGTYGAQLPYYVVNSALEAIANGTPYNEADVWRKSNELLKKRLTYLGNPTGDAISREQVLKELMAHQYSQDFCKEHGIEYSINSSMVRIIVNGAQAVEPERPQCNQIAWEQGYEAGLAQGKQDRPKGEWLEYNATGKKQYMCSECSMKEKKPKIARYCYWCGADMRGGADNEKTDK